MATRARIGASLVALAACISFGCWAFAQSYSGSPVQSVNGQQGAVSIPTIQRQVSAALDISSGSVSWTFPTQFTNQPTCWVSVTSSAANTVFSQAVTTAISQTAVTVSLKAAVTAVNILTLGTITFWGNPPSGTYVTLSCVGALP